jgi:hypothetical protein
MSASRARQTSRKITSRAAGYRFSCSPAPFFVESATSIGGPAALAGWCQTMPPGTQRRRPTDLRAGSEGRNVVVASDDLPSGAARRSSVGVSWRCAIDVHLMRERAMSKGLDKRREAKKKPTRSLHEKREKKQSRGFQGLCGHQV